MEGIGMKLCGVDLFGNIPQKIIRRGNQFARTKTLVTDAGNITARLQNDTVTIAGPAGQKARVAEVTPLGHTELSQKDMSEIFFNNFERLFDPKYDAWPAIKKALS